MVMEFIRQQSEKQEKSSRLIIEKLDKQIEKQEEIMQNMNEQFTLFRTEIREYKNALKADKSEVQKNCLLYTSRCV